MCAVRVPTLECFVAMPAREGVRRGRIKADIVLCQHSLNADILDAFKLTCSSVEYKQLPGSFGIYEQADFSKKTRFRSRFTRTQTNVSSHSCISEDI